MYLGSPIERMGQLSLPSNCRKMPRCLLARLLDSILLPVVGHILFKEVGVLELDMSFCSLLLCISIEVREKY
jgi:hypothetical protein